MLGTPAAETRSRGAKNKKISQLLPRHSTALASVASVRLPDTFPSGIGLKAHAGQVCGLGTGLATLRPGFPRIASTNKKSQMVGAPIWLGKP